MRLCCRVQAKLRCLHIDEGDLAFKEIHSLINLGFPNLRDKEEWMDAIFLPAVNLQHGVVNWKWYNFMQFYGKQIFTASGIISTIILNIAACVYVSRHDHQDCASLHFVTNLSFGMRHKSWSFTQYLAVNYSHTMVMTFWFTHCKWRSDYIGGASGACVNSKGHSADSHTKHADCDWHYLNSDETLRVTGVTGEQQTF